MHIIDKRLQAAATEFLSSAKVSGFSASAKRTYQRVLDRLVASAGNIKASDLRERHIDKLFLDLRTGGDEVENYHRQRAGWAKRSGRDNRTLNSDRAVIRRFIKFLHARHYLSPEFDPTLALDDNAPRKKTFHIDDAILSRDEGRRALEAADLRHPRDRVVVAIGLHACFRESETLELRIGGVDFGRKKLRVWRDKPDEWHEINMNEPLERELRHWLTRLQLEHGELDPDWYVVGAKVNILPGKYLGKAAMNRHWPVDPRKKAWGICKDVVKAFRAAGIPPKAMEGSHTLRRTGACWLLEDTGDIRKVMAHLGHKQQATTEIYLQFGDDSERVRAAVRSWDPLGEIEPDGGEGVVTGELDDVTRLGDNVISLVDRRRMAG